MNQSVLSVRINDDDKKKFEKFCNQTGMNISVAINMFIKKVIQEQRIPFEINTETFKEELERKLLEAEDDIKNGRLYTLEEAVERLKKELK